MKTEKAIFAAGCFWGVEEAFRKTNGVVSTMVGYTGGRTKNPTYADVCRKETGHAEAVLLEFDPKVISYERLLDVFWRIHDPTQKNRQGVDVGSQYRSSIFCVNDKQRNAAEASKNNLKLSGRFDKPIATEVTKAQEFYKAEEYHQQYIAKGGHAACHV